MPTLIVRGDCDLITVSRSARRKGQRGRYHAAVWRSSPAVAICRTLRCQKNSRPPYRIFGGVASLNAVSIIPNYVGANGDPLHRVAAGRCAAQGCWPRTEPGVSVPGAPEGRLDGQAVWIRSERWLAVRGGNPCQRARSVASEPMSQPSCIVGLVASPSRVRAARWRSQRGALHCSRRRVRRLACWSRLV
jgi:hypothetical protein